jgi:dTMP kinase
VGVYERLVLVIIDGLDASGKDTQANILVRSLQDRRKSVFLRIHPTADNLFGTKAKQFLYLRGKGAHFASALFYMLDVLRSVMLFSWRNYDYVVFVRYLMGTAYLPPPMHVAAYRFFALVVPTSEFMFFLDVSPEEAEKRIRQVRRKVEMFENLAELKRIRLKALSLASAGGWRVLDANKPERDVARIIVEILQSPTDSQSLVSPSGKVRAF